MKTTDGIDCTFQDMNENTRAVDLERPISTIREHFTGELADWEADFSTFLKGVEAKAASQSHEVEAVHRRVEAQDTLKQTLKIKAEEAVTLRKAIHEKDLELEKKRSEIDSKHELIDALQRDVQGIGRLKDAIRTRDKEIARLVEEKRHAQRHAAELTEEFKILTAELEAVRAELDARKTLIESPRGDAARTQALEAQLEEKRDVISKLEASIDRHVSTLAESQQSVTTWKEKYASLKSRKSSSESTIAPKPIEEELQAQGSAVDISDDLTTATSSQKMRESLLAALQNSRA